MASLNLINWRQPDFRHQLVIQKRWISGCVLCLILVGIVYSISYQPLVRPLEKTVLANQARLEHLLGLERSYQQARDSLEQQYQTEQANHQQVLVLKHFISLNTAANPGLQREKLTWLPGELKITGTYQAIASVKKLATSLRDTWPNSVVKVDFPRNGQFSMVLRDESLQ
ncbi:MAG: hypothetical protein ACQEQ8_07510 [Pseudomonadota bacterium]